ncbi:ropporin-1-like protein [Nelusetta ayraudi]|uniref:ropporin-1-like protein n=1 Tax=Nelusetta ayraudi TaxID=303726 RepID=UPI003F71ECF2
MPLPDTIYCSQQITIPPQLPDILKNFAKAAIRTQPKDLLLWSADYFTALSRGEDPSLRKTSDATDIPAKISVGLTAVQLKELHAQMSRRESCSREELQEKWTELQLPMEQLETLLSLGNFGPDISWMAFFAHACTALGGGLLTSLKFACEILTEDEEGGAASIPFFVFVRLYTYLAEQDGDIPQEHIDTFLSSLQAKAEQQKGMIKPPDFLTINPIPSTP